MAEITLKQITKKYDDHVVIDHMDLEIPDGKFTILVGPSGCGKTTLLRMIAGIEPMTGGEILMDGQNLTGVAPGKRNLAMVFQNYAIYPTMTVRDNIEFGLKNNHVPKDERERRIQKVCRIVGLQDYLSRKPGTLSGGQRQRVALARAMVKNPKAFLMDEPLSNLDAKLRTSMRTELIELHRRIGATFIYVTHDQVEAMAMADRIVLLNEGKIMQIGSPAEIYLDPDNVFTAQFIGTPSMNICTMASKDDLSETGKKFGFRPEKAVLTTKKTDMAVSVPGRILTREMLGSETIYKVHTDRMNVMVKTPDNSFAVDQQVYLNVEKTDLYYFAPDGSRIRGENEVLCRSMTAWLGGTDDE